MKWSESDRKILLEAKELGLSARQIAERIGGVTRNAVIGMLNRLGVSSPRAQHRQTPPKPSQSRARPSRPPPMKSTPDDTLVAMAATVTAPDAIPEIKPLKAPPKHTRKRSLLSELESDQCCWPVNDGNPFRFCGDKREPRSVYCALHTAMAYNVSQAVRRRTEH